MHYQEEDQTHNTAPCEGFIYAVRELWRLPIGPIPSLQPVKRMQEDNNKVIEHTVSSDMPFWMSSFLLSIAVTRCTGLAYSFINS